MENNYNSILNLFSRGNNFHDWTGTPFIIGDKAYATDYHCLAIVDSNLTVGLETLKDYNPEHVLAVVPPLRSDLLHFNIDVLDALIDKCPLIDPVFECESCQGEGEVEFNYEFKNRYYTTKDECPLCKGEGEITKKGVGIDNKIIDPDMRIKINQSHFAVSFLKKLSIAAKMIDVDEVILTHQLSTHSTSIFKIGEVEVLIMPKILDKDESEDDYVIGTI